MSLLGRYVAALAIAVLVSTCGNSIPSTEPSHQPVDTTISGELVLHATENGQFCAQDSLMITVGANSSIALLDANGDTIDQQSLANPREVGGNCAVSFTLEGDGEGTVSFAIVDHIPGKDAIISTKSSYTTESIRAAGDSFFLTYLDDFGP